MAAVWAARRCLADSSNDAMDVLSAIVALIGLSITLHDPARFVAFDHIGGFGVGIIVIVLGLRIMRDTVLQLMDTMPDEECWTRSAEWRYRFPAHWRSKNASLAKRG